MTYKTPVLKSYIDLTAKNFRQKKNASLNLIESTEKAVSGSLRGMRGKKGYTDDKLEPKALVREIRQTVNAGDYTDTVLASKERANQAKSGTATGPGHWYVEKLEENKKTNVFDFCNRPLEKKWKAD